MTPARIGIGLATVAALVLLFVLVRPGGDDASVLPAMPATPRLEPIGTQTEVEEPEPEPEPGPTRLGVRVEDGRPAGGIRRFAVDRGTEILVVVVSDVSDHVHVHGYDLMQDVAPGRPAHIAFVADVPGRFEIELEDRHRPIAELTVRP